MAVAVAVASHICSDKQVVESAGGVSWWLLVDGAAPSMGRTLPTQAVAGCSRGASTFGHGHSTTGCSGGRVLVHSVIA